MATLNQAEAARDSEADRLRRLGAHAVEVRKVRRKGRATFAVVAFFEKRIPPSLPNGLQITRGTKRIVVELLGKIGPAFRPD